MSAEGPTGWLLNSRTVLLHCRLNRLKKAGIAPYPLAIFKVATVGLSVDNASIDSQIQ